MWLSSSPYQPYSINQLDFDGDRCRSSGSGLALALGATVVFLLYMSMPPSSPYPMMRPLASSCASMRALVSRGVASARRAVVSTGGGDAYFFASARERYPMAGPIPLCEYSKVKDVPTVPTEAKEKVMQAFDRVLAKSDRTPVLAFAHWCGHCKNAMPEFAEAVKGKPAVMVHGDCMTDEKLKKVQLEHYPTFLVHNKSDGSFEKFESIPMMKAALEQTSGGGMERVAMARRASLNAKAPGFAVDGSRQLRTAHQSYDGSFMDDLF